LPDHYSLYDFSKLCHGLAVRICCRRNLRAFSKILVRKAYLEGYQIHVRLWRFVHRGRLQCLRGRELAYTWLGTLSCYHCRLRQLISYCYIQTSSNGPNWVGYLRSTYNITNTQVFNLAYGGATIDSKLVTPYLPTYASRFLPVKFIISSPTLHTISVQSIVTQVGLFDQYLARKPAGAKWSSNNTLFAFWIGINDVGNSYYWTNTTQAAFHKTLMNRLFGQVTFVIYQGCLTLDDISPTRSSLCMTPALARFCSSLYHRQTALRFSSGKALPPSHRSPPL
jgi:hypothetical protein